MFKGGRAKILKITKSRDHSLGVELRILKSRDKHIREIDVVRKLTFEKHAFRKKHGANSSNFRGQRDERRCANVIDQILKEGALHK